MKRAQIVIPPGARGKEQMSGKDVQKTKKIANLRIHVERAKNGTEFWKEFYLSASCFWWTTLHVLVQVCVTCLIFLVK